MRPVQLQLNNSGAWKTIARWDAGDDDQTFLAQESVTMLGSINPTYTWRIATQADHPIVLRNWCAAHGWRDGQ